MSNSYNSAPTDAHPLALPVLLGKEFLHKVQYDFSKLLFLGVVPGKEAYLMEIIDEASSFPGYEKHKTIKYRSDGCEKTCHLYVKYGSSEDAFLARDKFRELDDLNAELVSDILKSWYTYEKFCCPYGSVTRGILDFVGKVSFNEVLDEDIVNSLLHKFGRPRIYIDKGVVNVAFSSMAEGIAACIVYGKWRVKKDDQDPAFYYRVQLEGTDSFSAVIQKSTQSPGVSEAYKLEYFALPNDVPQSTFNYAKNVPQNNFNYGDNVPQNNFNYGDNVPSNFNYPGSVSQSTFNYENASRGRNFLRTGRQFVRSRPNYNNYRGGNYRQNRPKYQSTNVYPVYNSDHFSQDETYYQQPEVSYFGQS